MTRNKYLDIVRGIAAISIMFYHYISDSLSNDLDASNFFSRLGYYGVSIFYILSGLTLSVVYENKINNLSDSYFFYKKRILRIYPLMIVCTLITLTYIETPTILTIILNISGLFGVFDFKHYIGVGTWSIGNEIVFYIFFPILLHIRDNKRQIFLIITFISFSILLIISHNELNPSKGYSWESYINPVNQFFYFLIGMLINQFKKINLRLSLYFLSISILVFCFFPINGNHEKLIYSYYRTIFSICCILFVYSVYNLSDLKVKDRLINPAKTLILLGEISYGIYLLHPIIAIFVYKIIDFLAFGYISASIRIPLMSLLTFGVSYLSYNYFELPIVKKFANAER